MLNMADDRLPIVDEKQDISTPNRQDPQDKDKDRELDLKTVGCCNPASRFHRFLALIFMCLLGFGK